METFYKIFQVQIKEKTGNWNRDSYESYKFRSPKSFQLDRSFNTKMDAQVAIEKYGEGGVTYIIQECYGIPYESFRPEQKSFN